MSLLVKNGAIVTASECYVTDIFRVDETITHIEPNMGARQDSSISG